MRKLIITLLFIFCFVSTGYSATKWWEDAENSLGGAATTVAPTDRFLIEQGLQSKTATKAKIIEGLATEADLTAHEENVLNPHSVTKTQVGLGYVENIKVNLTAVINPTVTADSSIDYSVGSKWVNTVSGRIYECVDATVGAAVWKEITVQQLSSAEIKTLYELNNDTNAFTDAEKTKLTNLPALTIDQINALNNASTPTAANPFATVNDIVAAGGGDMMKATYDPTNKSADAFAMDNMVEGIINKILTSAERTKLNNLSGINTGDQDLSGKEDVGVAAGLISSHEGTYFHDDIAHANRLALDSVSGVNTGDQDLSGKEDVGVAAGLMTDHTTIHPAPTNRDTRNEPAKGADDYFVTSAEKAALHPIVDISGKADLTDARFPTTDEKAALTNAASPSADNPVATIADLQIVESIPTSFNVITGGTVTGTVAGVAEAVDGLTLGVQETNGLTGWDIQFTIITDHFNQIAIRLDYEGAVNHEWYVQLWNYVASDWSTLNPVAYQGTEAWTWLSFDIPDDTTYRNVSDEVILRFIHTSSGNTSHYVEFDYIALYHSARGGANTLHNALAGRSESDSHPIDAITGLTTELAAKLETESDPAVATHESNHPAPTNRDTRNEPAKGTDDNFVTDDMLGALQNAATPPTAANPVVTTADLPEPSFTQLQPLGGLVAIRSSSPLCNPAHVNYAADLAELLALGVGSDEYFCVNLPTDNAITAQNLLAQVNLNPVIVAVDEAPAVTLEHLGAVVVLNPVSVQVEGVVTVTVQNLLAQINLNPVAVDVIDEWPITAQSLAASVILNPVTVAVQASGEEITVQYLTSQVSLNPATVQVIAASAFPYSDTFTYSGNLTGNGSWATQTGGTTHTANGSVVPVGESINQGNYINETTTATQYARATWSISANGGNVAFIGVGARLQSGSRSGYVCVLEDYSFSDQYYSLYEINNGTMNTGTSQYTSCAGLCSHTYLRIRASGSNIYCDSSSNGTTWTQRATFTDTTYASGYVGLFSKTGIGFSGTLDNFYANEGTP